MLHPEIGRRLQRRERSVCGVRVAPLTPSGNKIHVGTSTSVSFNHESMRAPRTHVDRRACSRTAIENAQEAVEPLKMIQVDTRIDQANAMARHTGAHELISEGLALDGQSMHQIVKRLSMSGLDSTMVITTGPTTDGA